MKKLVSIALVAMMVLMIGILPAVADEEEENDRPSVIVSRALEEIEALENADLRDELSRLVSAYERALKVEQYEEASWTDIDKVISARSNANEATRNLIEALVGAGIPLNRVTR